MAPRLRHGGRPGPYGVRNRVFQRNLGGKLCGQGPDERVSGTRSIHDFHFRGREVLLGFTVREHGAVFSECDHDGSWPQGQEPRGGIERPIYTFDALSEEEGGLVLVDHQGIKLLEQCPRNLERGRQVDQRAGPAPCRDLDGPLDDLGRDFHLGDEYPGLSDGSGGFCYIIRCEAAVRSWCDRDRVLPIGGDGYEGRACRRIGDLLHEARIDALIRERPYEWSAEAIVAHAAEEGDARPEEGRGGGLVGSFAAVVGCKTSIRDRLSWRGTALYAQDEVLVYRTNDEDVSHSVSPLQTTISSSRALGLRGRPLPRAGTVSRRSRRARLREAEAHASLQARHRRRVPAQPRRSLCLQRRVQAPCPPRR